MNKKTINDIDEYWINLGGYKSIEGYNKKDIKELALQTKEELKKPLKDVVVCFRSYLNELIDKIFKKIWGIDTPLTNRVAKEVIDNGRSQGTRAKSS